ncbi:MAG: hypothetical protein M1819_002874 [Sarea resinae]|nr:MAG: hypothetical protein M1819_002874 [Sarea resinae]
MRLSSSWLLMGLGSVSAARSTAPVHIFEPSSPLSQAQSQHASRAAEELSPETARLAIARRLGLSQFHSLDDADDGTIKQLEKFGGEREQILGEESGEGKPAVLLLMVEGVENPDDLLASARHPSFTISNPPDASANEKLMFDLEKQLEFLSEYEAEGEPSTPAKDSEADPNRYWGVDILDPTLTSEELILGLKSFRDALGDRFLGRSRKTDGVSVLHLRTLQNIVNKEGAGSKSYKTALRILSDALKTLPRLASENTQSTTLILMPASSSTISQKRSASPYGTYDLPTRRQQRQPEALLSSEAPAPPPPQSAPSSPLVSIQNNPAAAAGAACHTSLHACETSTNNCSSHGSCALSPSRRDCYTCLCTPSIRTNDDGTTKTTVWVGPACQRKDVSMPFLLLAGLSVALVGAVTWGVSLLMTMGAEELPSVLSAGVGGVRPK